MWILWVLFDEMNDFSKTDEYNKIIGHNSVFTYPTNEIFKLIKAQRNQNTLQNQSRILKNKILERKWVKIL